MTDPLRRYEDVLAAITKLPATPAGYVRVFRGQTKDYPTILPSGLRRSIRKEAIWRAYTQNLYADLMPEAEPGRPFNLATGQAWGLWLHAVAQHYGPGSNFVDVTHSVEVALWFALNEFKTQVVEGVITGAGRDPENPARHPTLVELLRCEPWGGTGYLYVWDLPQWDGHALAEAGVIVDLAYAPPVFSESPRMRAQKACLVYCGVNPREALDLRSGLVPGTPLLSHQRFTLCINQVRN